MTVTAKNVAMMGAGVVAELVPPAKAAKQGLVRSYVETANATSPRHNAVVRQIAEPVLVAV